MMIRLEKQYHRRRLNLTPMIDVIFLLLIFFMLTLQLDAKRFIPITSQADLISHQIPKLIEVTLRGVQFNGAQVREEDLGRKVLALLESADDVVAVRPQENVDLQRVMNIVLRLRGAGITRIALVE